MTGTLVEDLADTYAEVKRLRAEVERLKQILEEVRAQRRDTESERDRYAAVLADTPENMAAIRAALRSMCNWGDALIEAILGDQRRRAGIE